MKHITIFLLLIVAVFANTNEERVMVPYESGVENFTYLKPFWLVSKPVMTDLLATYAIKTNEAARLAEYTRLTAALMAQTNADGRLREIDRNTIKRLEKEVLKLRIGRTFIIMGTATVTAGIMALLYEVAGRQSRGLAYQVPLTFISVGATFTIGGTISMRRTYERRRSNTMY